MGEQLGWYETDARALLNDTFGMFTPKTQLDRWINQGRRQVAKVTGCLQVVVPDQAPFGSQATLGTAATTNPSNMIVGGVIPGADPNSTFQCIPNVEKYPFLFANPYVQAWNEGVDMVLDVQQVAISWSGAMRPALDWMPWDDFQAYLRAYQNLMTSYPAIWSTTGDGETGNVWLYPPPSEPSGMQWLVICAPKSIYTDSDYDAIPSPFTDAVKYWAARMASMSSKRFGEAEVFEDQFYNHLGIDRVAVDRGKSPTYYWSYP